MNALPASDASAMIFHGSGHLRRWENSPLGNQDPHLWTAFLMTFVICGIVLGVKLIRNRRNSRQKAEATGPLDELRLALGSKQQRLEAKILELEKNYRENNLPAQEYGELLQEYESSLQKVKDQVQEIASVTNREATLNKGASAVCPERGTKG